MDTHAADFGAAFVSEVETIIHNFMSARETQLQFKGLVETARTKTVTDRNVIERQLMKNILIIASNNVGNKKAVEKYFDQSFIKRRKEDIHKGKLAAKDTKNMVVRTFDAAKKDLLKNLGETELEFGLCFDAVTKVAGGVKLGIRQTLKTEMSEFGNLDNKYFNVTNLSAEHLGEYKVEFL